MLSSPNILLITCHDLGRHLGCYGVQTVNSPCIDQFAGDAVRLVNCFSAAPQCSPSRAAMMTGRYPHCNGVLGLTHGDFGWDLHSQERHLATLLRESGYATALAGIQHETRRPEQMGFDQILPADGCDAVAAKAARFLADKATSTRPWYLQVGFFEPHRASGGFAADPDSSRGVCVPPYLQDSDTAREDFAGFQGAIRKVDATIGRVFEALDEAGMAGNTIVLVTTDHGIPFPRAKCSLYDPGLEVACLLRWPGGGIGGGRVVAELISNVDYLPTLLELAGLPCEPGVQGGSFAPLLRRETFEPRAEVFAEMTFHDYCDPRRCIRTATHKLIANFSSAPQFMDPSQSWHRKTVTRDPADPTSAYHPPVELYDLGADPLESENLAGVARYEDACRELLAKLSRWMQQTGDPILSGIPLSPLHQRALLALRDCPSPQLLKVPLPC